VDCLYDPDDTIGNDGYARRWNPLRGQTTSALKSAYEQVHGLVEEGHDVHHKCHDHKCRNVEHAEVIEAFKHNSQDHRRFTEDQVREIKSRLGSCTKAALAREYGVAYMTITYIERGKTWSWV
jgi:hypothetical protein